MVKVERTPVPPASLAAEKSKAGGSYNQTDVVELLFADFHGKCYLCEKDELDSIEIDHLLPHHGGRDRDRMFDWNNLFFCCAHCNSVKNQKKYEQNVIDCCAADPETLIKQELINRAVCVTPLIESDEARNTASLIQDCYELRNRAIRTLECQTKVRALQQTMTILRGRLDAYEAEKKETDLRTLRGMLARSYKFAGFTRTYVRTRQDRYPELAALIDEL